MLSSKALVRNLNAAAVFSLETLSTQPEVHFTTVPRPVRGPAVRPPGVAGTFYPGDPVELSRMMDGLLKGEARPESWPAALVPHAGLIYSGHIAARRVPATEDTTHGDHHWPQAHASGNGMGRGTATKLVHSGG